MKGRILTVSSPIIGYGHPFHASSRHACRLSCARVQPGPQVQEPGPRQITNSGTGGGCSPHPVAAVGTGTRRTKQAQGHRALASRFPAHLGAVGFGRGGRLVLAGSQQRGSSQITSDIACFVRTSAHKRLERQHHSGQSQVQRLKKKPVALTHNGLSDGAVSLRTNNTPLKRKALQTLLPTFDALVN